MYRKQSAPYLVADAVYVTVAAVAYDAILGSLVNPDFDLSGI
jgi:hypothetical protein